MLMIFATPLPKSKYRSVNFLKNIRNARYTQGWIKQFNSSLLHMMYTGTTYKANILCESKNKKDVYACKTYYIWIFSIT